MFWLTASAMPASSHSFDEFPSLGDRQGQRLLSEDAAEVTLADLDGPADQGRLHVGRHGDIEDFHFRVGEQVLNGIVNGRDPVPCGDRLRALSQSARRWPPG